MVGAAAGLLPQPVKFILTKAERDSRMPVFQHILWGYELTYPDNWVNRTLGDIENFAAIQEALDPDYLGPNSGQILIRCEWNGTLQPIEPLWNRHIGMLASWLGAKEVGSAPWNLSGASGLEAEIVLPKKDDRRLWTGILQRDRTLLHFVVLHLKLEYPIFQPLATQIISSLRFSAGMAGVLTSQVGLPLPPDYQPVPAEDFINGIQDPTVWQAYDGESSIEGLQAFYMREAPNYGWSILDYVSFPSPTDLGFARMVFEKDGRKITLGLLPYEGEQTGTPHPARIFFKLNSEA